MRRFNILYSIVFSLILIVSFNVKGEEDEQNEAIGQVRISIADYMRNDSIHPVIIEQPSALDKLLLYKESEKKVGCRENNVEDKILGGYRIQVFSDKNPRTAQSEAIGKQKNISKEFPILGTYITYKAPFWRLRVGDFETVEEAIEMLDEIKKVFPSYSRELTIVRDRIILE